MCWKEKKTKWRDKKVEGSVWKDENGWKDKVRDDYHFKRWQK